MFRGGTLTGPAHSAAELHGFLAYLMRCVMEGRTYNLYGYKGKMVRDAIHSHDVLTAFEAFFRDPRSGEVYNLGGGRHSNTSHIEAFRLAEEICRPGGPDQLRRADPDRRPPVVGSAAWPSFEEHYPEWTTDLRRTGHPAGDPRRQRGQVGTQPHDRRGQAQRARRPGRRDRLRRRGRPGRDAAARDRRPFALTALAVHGVMTGVQDHVHAARLNAFDVVTPDGQPVRWALNLLHRAGLPSGCTGPTLTLRVLRTLRRRGPTGLPVRSTEPHWTGWDRLGAAPARR